jgi:hypothetical protein
MLHILILDEKADGFENQADYINFVSDAEVKLMIITSKGHIPEESKSKYLGKDYSYKEYAEFLRPTNNGLVELLALKWHKKHRIDRVYTCEEEIVLRAAGIRKLLGLKSGLYPEEALLFRDKAAMKKNCLNKGIPIPKFVVANTPSDMIAFVQETGYPIICKPTLRFTIPNESCASVGLNVISNDREFEKYLEKDFYKW